MAGLREQASGTNAACEGEGGEKAVCESAGNHARGDKVVDGVNAEDAEHVSLLAYLHAGKLGGEGGANATSDDDARDDRGELASHGEGQDAADSALETKAGKLASELRSIGAIVRVRGKGRTGSAGRAWEERAWRVKTMPTKAAVVHATERVCGPTRQSCERALSLCTLPEHILYTTCPPSSTALSERITILGGSHLAPSLTAPLAHVALLFLPTALAPRAPSCRTRTPPPPNEAEHAMA